MAHKANYSNTHKYDNRRSFDKQPIPDGLVPFHKEKFDLQKGDYIQDNFTTMHLGEFSFEIGFMAIAKNYYVSYMKDFWDELNKDMEICREGRCYQGSSPSPQIRLEGKWLEQLGFTAGSFVSIQCEEGRLVIEKDTAQ